MSGRSSNFTENHSLNFFKWIRFLHGKQGWWEVCVLKLNRSIHAPLTDGRSRVKYIKEDRVKKNVFLSIFFFKYQNNINQPATQCFLSVTNWERESVLDFVLHVGHYCFNFHFLFFSSREKPSLITIFTLSPRKSERPRAQYRQIEAGWHIELHKLVLSSVAQITKLIQHNERTVP